MSSDAQMQGPRGHRRDVISGDDTLRDFRLERADWLDRRDRDPQHLQRDAVIAYRMSDHYQDECRLERERQAALKAERELNDRFEHINFPALFSDASYVYYRWAEDWADGRRKWYDPTNLLLPSAHGRMEEAVASGLHALFLIAENNIFGADACQQARELIDRLDAWKMVAALADTLGAS